MSKEKKPETPNLITGEDEAIKTPRAFAAPGQRGSNSATKATLKQNPGSKLAEKEEELDEKKAPKKKKEVKKKKPDADGDGVPDWADKHPGKDDADFEKKISKATPDQKTKFIRTITKGIKDLTEKESKLNEAVSRYIRLKENPKKNSYKVSLITQEITKMLREVDFLMSVNHKLKTEMEVPNETLWKRTSDRMAEIKARLKSIGEKLRKIQ